MKLFIFAASHRPDSVNRKLARLASAQASHTGHAAQLRDYGDFDMPIYNDHAFDAGALPQGATRFLEALAGADAMVIASPEYNWSFPGSLKNIIDWVSRLNPSPFAGKPILLLSATPSLRGGISGIYSLKIPLEALGAHVFSRVYVLGNAYQAFDAHDAIADAKQRALFEETMSGFLAFAGALTK